MKRAWIVLVVCAAGAAQVPQPADPRQQVLDARQQAAQAALLQRALENNARTDQAAMSRTLVQWSAWQRTTGPAARSNASRFLSEAPDSAQIALLLQQQSDPNAAAELQNGRVNAAALQHLDILRRLPPDEHLEGLSTLAKLNEVLLLGSDERRQHVLPYAAAIGKGSPATVAALVRCLDSTDVELRWRAALGLSWSAGTAAGREAVPALIEHLRDSDQVVSAFAAGALAKLAPKTPELEPALIELQQSRDSVVVNVVALVRRDVAMQGANGRRGANGQRPPTQGQPQGQGLLPGQGQPLGQGQLLLPKPQPLPQPRAQSQPQPREPRAQSQPQPRTPASRRTAPAESRKVVGGVKT